MKNSNGTNEYYTYTNQLGSIVKVTDDAGTVIASQSFDAWGRKRHPANWSYSGIPNVPSWLYRGYTGHEMLPEFELINMNGRMYDPLLGRMLNPDNVVSNPENTQRYNRYSYVMNNPLKYTDPTGWEEKNLHWSFPNPWATVYHFSDESYMNAYNASNFGRGNGAGGSNNAGIPWVYNSQSATSASTVIVSGEVVNDGVNQYPDLVAASAAATPEGGSGIFTFTDNGNGNYTMNGTVSYGDISYQIEPTSVFNPIAVTMPILEIDARGNTSYDLHGYIQNTLGNEINSMSNFANFLGILMDAGRTMFGGAEMGLQWVRQNNGHQTIGRFLGVGTQQTATALRNTLGVVSTTGKVLGNTGYGLQAGAIVYKVVNNIPISTAEKVGLGVSTFLVGSAYFAAGTVAAPWVAGVILIYGTAELFSYGITGNTLEENYFGK